MSFATDRADFEAVTWRNGHIRGRSRPIDVPGRPGGRAAASARCYTGAPPAAAVSEAGLHATIESFRTALRLGTGRAMLLLRASPGDPALNAALLDACRTNLVFDVQCEPARAPYLARLIAATGRTDAFADEIAASLAAGRHGGGRDDFVQGYEVLCLVAADAPGFDRGVLWTLLEHFPFRPKRPDRQGSAPQGSVRAHDLGPISDRPDEPLWSESAPERADPWAGLMSCAEALVRLEGFPALVSLLERFGGGDAMDPREFECLLDVLRRRDGIAETDRRLATARSAVPGLDSKLDRLAAASGRPPAAQPAEDYAAVRRRLAAGEHRFPPRWWERATDAELRSAAADLLAETEDGRRLPYLRLFARIDFPLPPEPLLPLAASSDRHVRYQAARALGRLDHPAVRRLALATFADGTTQWHLGPTLLGGSATDDDAPLFGPLVDQSPDEEELHRRCSGILRIIASGRLSVDAAVPLLLRIYAVTPCSNCRGDAVRLLAGAGRLPGWVAEECAFDAAEATAAAAATAAPVDRHGAAVG